EFTEFADCRLRRFTGGNHHPRHAGGRERFDELGQRLDVGDLGIPVVAHDLVAGPAQPFGHVPAHPAQTNHSDLHGEGPYPRRGEGYAATGVPSTWDQMAFSRSTSTVSSSRSSLTTASNSGRWSASTWRADCSAVPSIPS